MKKENKKKESIYVTKKKPDGSATQYIPNDIIPKGVTPVFNGTMEDTYMELSARNKYLVDSIAMGVEFKTLYPEYFNGYEHEVHMRNKLLHDPKNPLDLSTRAKETLISEIIRKNMLSPIINHRRNLIKDIYIETFRKKALDTCISKEFLNNELLKLREKINELDTEKQVKYELKVIELMDKIIKQDEKPSSIANIQINNNMPNYD